MTYKNGAIIGIVTGFLSWLILQGYFVFTPNPQLLPWLLGIIGGLFTIIAFALGIAYLANGHSTFGTTWDGFFYGFFIVFDAFAIASALLAGKLPSLDLSILSNFL
jgi:hypothetical protein